MAMTNLWQSVSGEWMKIKKEWNCKLEAAGLKYNIANPKFASREGCWQGKAGMSNIVLSANENGLSKVYLYSDGYKDQFGGVNNKRLGSNSFGKLLHSISKFNLIAQREEIETNFLLWKGDYEQTDDVCVMALEF
jgi:hypothetical protein